MSGQSTEQHQPEEPNSLSAKWWVIILFRAVLIPSYVLSLLIPQIPKVVAGALWLPTLLFALIAVPAFYYDSKQIWRDDDILWEPSAVLNTLLGLALPFVADVYYLYNRRSNLNQTL